MSVDLRRDSKSSALKYIAQERNFNQLFLAIVIAKLQDTLGALETVTVFAPSNEAFRRLEKIWSQYQPDELDNFMGDIVKYHLVAKKLTIDEIVQGQARGRPYFETLLDRKGSSAKELINFYYDGASRELTLNRLISVGKPIVVTNGLIYPIDDVLLPVHLENKIGYLETTTI